MTGSEKFDRMYYLQKIKLYHYKNYSLAEIPFHSKLNAILGWNGMGKTNLLDAIYYSCLGRSYFSSGDRNVIQHGADFFRIESVFSNQDIREKFVAKVIPSKSKELSVNGKKIDRIVDFVGRYPVVIIAPMDIQLLLQGSAERRKFINQTLLQYDKQYGNALLDYNRALRQRNALLKKFAEERKWDKALLQVFTERMSAPAAYIHQKRSELIQEMIPLFSRLYSRISDEHEVCELIYKSHLSDMGLSVLHEKSIERDRILTRTTRGIHKDDLIFMMNGDFLKPFGSQGQLKSFVLGLKLTQYHILKEKNQKKPILLLDDLFDKLDRNRVEHLLRILHEDSYGQVFISDKDEKDIPAFLDKISKDYAIFVIDEGALKYSEEE